jgi:hypothetical protein
VSYSTNLCKNDSFAIFKKSRKEKWEQDINFKVELVRRPLQSLLIANSIYFAGPLWRLFLLKRLMLDVLDYWSHMHVPSPEGSR